MKSSKPIQTTRPKEKYTVSADKKHLYCYSRIWGDKYNVLCVLLHHPRKKGFDPKWNNWAKLAKRLKYGGVRITFCYSLIPNKGSIGGRGYKNYLPLNNAKSAIIRRKAILSSISLITTNEIYDSKDNIFLALCKKVRENYISLWVADEYYEDILNPMKVYLVPRAVVDPYFHNP